MGIFVPITSYGGAAHEGAHPNRGQGRTQRTTWIRHCYLLPWFCPFVLPTSSI